jgi:hypothetical protein
MTKTITSIVLALSVLAIAGQANAAPISGPSDFAVHGYVGTAYGK